MSVIDDPSPAALRRELHRIAEPSNAEHDTARLIAEVLGRTGPCRIVTGLGGAGLAAVYEGRERGPRVLLRADLDALPIDETIGLPYGARQPGVSHKCGHDGHMAMVASVGRRLGAQPLERGTAILLFQPAEETGEGAARVLADPKFAELVPDWAFATHNLPGYPLGAVVLRTGPFAAASRGFVVELRGRTSHAAEPELGQSPALAMAGVIGALSAAPQSFVGLHESAKVTVIHARLGSVAFGTTPGEAVVMATLRAALPEVMAKLSERCEALSQDLVRAHGLEVATRWTEDFPATVNAPEAVTLVRAAAERHGMPIVVPPEPFPWSEDFGHFTAAYPGALVGLGAGVRQPNLHDPRYDFPDELLAPGIDLLVDLVRATTNEPVPPQALG